MERRTPVRRKANFLARRRDDLITLGLLALTAVIGVAAADEVLDLGLFPTPLEREARELIATFASPDEGARRQAVAKLMRNVEAFVAIPELIRALDSKDLRVRELAADCLRKLARTSQGYDPKAPRPERRAAIARWRKWWRENYDRF